MGFMHELGRMRAPPPPVAAADRMADGSGGREAQVAMIDGRAESYINERTRAAATATRRVAE